MIDHEKALENARDIVLVCESFQYKRTPFQEKALSVARALIELARRPNETR
jgi:hypothetical protein